MSRARLRVRRVLVGEALAIFGIAVGVALLFATQVASTSLTRSVQELTRQVIGNQEQWQLDSRGPDGVSEAVLGDVRRLHGVRSAFPVLEQQANVIGPSGERAVDLIGTDPRFTNLGGPLLRRFSATQLAAQRAIALPTPLADAIGASSLQTIKIQVGARIIKTLLGTTLGEADIRGLVNSPVALAPVAYAQQLSGLDGRITRVFVQAIPGQSSQVHHALEVLGATTAMNVEPANFDSTLFATAVAPETQSEALFSAISALVGFMFAFNAMLITVPARRELLQNIKRLGASPVTIIQVLAFDAAVIAVLACVVGLLLGELLSIVVFHTTPGYLSFAFPVGNDRIVTWQAIGLALAAGVTAAALGVIWPLRNVLRRESPTHHRQARLGRAARASIGLFCLLITTLVLLLDTSAAVIGNVALIVAMICVLPLLFDGILWVLAQGQRRFKSAAVRLAVRELANSHTRVRSLAIATTAALAVLGTVEFQGTQANLAAGLDSSAHAIDSSADVWVTPAGESNAFATTSFSSRQQFAVRHLPGVTALSIYRGSFLNWGKRRLWVLAPPASAATSLIRGQGVEDPVSVGSAVSRGGWAVLSQVLATEHRLHVGGTFLLPSPRPTVLRVAGVSSNLGWPPGAIIMDSSDYADAWGSTNLSAFQVKAAPGISPATMSERVRQALGSETGLAVETAGQREHRHYALAAQGLSRLTQIRLLVLIAAVLAVTAAMSAMIFQRRDRVASLKTVGFSRAVLLRWLLYEAAILLSAGCSIGAAFGIYAQVLGSHFLASVTGFPIVFNVEALAALTSFALVTVLAVAIVAIPGYRVVRVPPSTASPAY